MRYLIVLIACLFIFSSAQAERICVIKKPKVNKAGRINMVRAIGFTTDECKKNQFELAVPQTEIPAAPTVLESGKSLTGIYALGGTADAANQLFRNEISFSLPLASAPSVEILEVGDAATVNCPGSATNPQAAPGYLCVYENSNGTSFIVPNTNRKSLDVRSLGSITLPKTSTRFGADISALSVGTGSVTSKGTWAVTAP